MFLVFIWIVIPLEPGCCRNEAAAGRGCRRGATDGARA